LHHDVIIIFFAIDVPGTTAASTLDTTMKRMVMIRKRRGARALVECILFFFERQRMGVGTDFLWEMVVI